MAVPAAVVANAPIANRIGVTDDWIVKRTGIRSRHVAAAGERLSELAAAAGARALELAGIDGGDVDLVLVATTTADELLPNAAPLVANALGAQRAGAIDVGAACTGFLSGLALATAQIEAARAEVVLLVGADLMTRITDPDCRHTAALFGDGAGAAVLTARSDGEGWIGATTLGADGGAGAELIVAERREPLVRMQGHETFKHAVARMSQATLDALVLAGLTLEDIDLFVYHQANARICGRSASSSGSTTSWSSTASHTSGTHRPQRCRLPSLTLSARAGFLPATACCSARSARDSLGVLRSSSGDDSPTMACYNSVLHVSQSSYPPRSKQCR
jgi:3-oxoacyl-[acyl-carrier-protein] synthase-3